MSHVQTLNCKGCDRPMWLEGKIDDDIPLCHACYQNNKLRIKYTKEELP
jgi:hypothetical protein